MIISQSFLGVAADGIADGRLDNPRVFAHSSRR
jgi:hypothetical protein